MNLLIDVRLLPDGYWSEWPPKAYPQFRVTIEPFHAIVFDGDVILEAAKWCNVDVSHFISTAVLEYLDKVQAAMGEGQVCIGE